MKKRKTAYILVATILCISTVLWAVALWVDSNLLVNIREVLFTLTNSMEGSNNDVVFEGMKACLPLVFLVWAMIIFCVVREYKRKDLIFWDGKIGKKAFRFCITKWVRISAVVLSVVLFIGAVGKIDAMLGISRYVRLSHSDTNIYAQKYVMPNPDQLTAENPKNVIYIYMESMENTYQSVQDGGLQSVNYMPNLTALAKEGISFSDDQKIGGFRPVDGTTWTTASLFASCSGIPFSYAAQQNDLSGDQPFMQGLITFGDVLEQKGYNQMFLCGAPAQFGGIRKLLSEHGDYRFFDLYTAREAGYLPTEDYHNGFWGFEDLYLYEIAKDEITKLYEEGKPFNFTMMTMDTHFKDGFVCALCENKYENKTANVVACADKQLAEFVSWCEQQPFYADTVIVIAGDHPRMDRQLVRDAHDFLERTMYNCFLNVKEQENVHCKNRDFTAMDMFPTVLSAMGFEIPGDRLGLGTDLFSDRKTIAEEMGIKAFQDEINKKTEFDYTKKADN